MTVRPTGWARPGTFALHARAPPDTQRPARVTTDGSASTIRLWMTAGNGPPPTPIQDLRPKDGALDWTQMQQSRAGGPRATVARNERRAVRQRVCRDARSSRLSGCSSTRSPWLILPSVSSKRSRPRTSMCSPVTWMPRIVHSETPRSRVAVGADEVLALLHPRAARRRSAAPRRCRPPVSRRRAMSASASWAFISDRPTREDASCANHHLLCQRREARGSREPRPSLRSTRRKTSGSFRDSRR
jgi:hypothetical protein